jgi:hypothetical protein
VKPDPRTLAAADLPRPDASLVLLGIFVEAFVATAHEKPSRRARSFLTAATKGLSDLQDVTRLLPIRSTQEHEAEAEATREAITWARQRLPGFMARLPPMVD